MIIDVLETGMGLSDLVALLQSGADKEIVITQEGVAIARLLAVEQPREGQRIGVAKGKFTIPASIDADNALIAELFLGLEE
jgi:antitoxin (DNA-binding transcriptional repressor) of toxin-antitoxin stability system